MNLDLVWCTDTHDTWHPVACLAVALGYQWLAQSCRRITGDTRAILQKHTTVVYTF